MEQHPVPQHIASYEFKLVGDMTLKQFFQVAGGALVALLFYASPLPDIIRWPAILLSGLIGATLAFLPFEERPLSIWLIAFLRAIYSPTKYSYQAGKSTDVFAPEEGPVPVSAETYLARPVGEEQIFTSLEEEERSFFQKVLSLFNLVKSPPQVITPQAQAQTLRPQLIVEEETGPVAGYQGPLATPPVSQPPTPSLPISQYPGIPQQPVSPVFFPTPPARRGPGRPRLTTPRTQLAITPPPFPGTPNVIVGQILDSEGGVVEAAILEIKDWEGRPVRAVRTNKVGHFLTATPLLPGIYEIITEKEGLLFDPVQVEIKNEIIPPIEIRAKGTEN